jgi:hypothetical protein
MALLVCYVLSSIRVHSNHVAWSDKGGPLSGQQYIQPVHHSPSPSYHVWDHSFTPLTHFFSRSAVRSMRTFLGAII